MKCLLFNLNSIDSFKWSFPLTVFFLFRRGQVLFDVKWILSLVVSELKDIIWKWQFIYRVFEIWIHENCCLFVQPIHLDLVAHSNIVISYCRILRKHSYFVRRVLWKFILNQEIIYSNLVLTLCTLYSWMYGNCINSNLILFLYPVIRM